jgi:hypothetical protein
MTDASNGVVGSSTFDNLTMGFPDTALLQRDRAAALDTAMAYESEPFSGWSSDDLAGSAK